MVTRSENLRGAGASLHENLKNSHKGKRVIMG